MAGFEKTKLATGEFRADYIRRRLGEGGTVKQIHSEINAPNLYSGPAGKEWPETAVYTEKRKLAALDAGAKPPRRTAPDRQERAVEEPPTNKVLPVPEEYEDILDAEDIAEIHAEAAAELRKKLRAQAKKELLAKVTQELAHQAQLAAERGAPKGDLVDVYIDLAPAVCVGKAKHLMPPSICLNGKHYIHGTTPRVPRAVASVLWEQMQRSWQHDASLKGQHDENAYRPHRVIDPRRDERARGIA